MKRLLIIGALMAVVLAAVVSFYASSQPDGLEKVAGDHGIAAQEQESATAGRRWRTTASAGWATSGSAERPPASSGVAITAAAGFGLFYAVRRRVLSATGLLDRGYVDAASRRIA